MKIENLSGAWVLDRLQGGVNLEELSHNLPDKLKKRKYKF